MGLPDKKARPKLYRLKRGVMGRLIDVAENPSPLSRWLQTETKFVIVRDGHWWLNGVISDLYVTIQIAGQDDNYNVLMTALESSMEEVSHPNFSMKSFTIGA